MIFKRISYMIALQFTAFVFLLSLLIGVLFFAADVQNANHGMRMHLERMLQGIIRSARRPADIPLSLPPVMRERVRIIDAENGPLFTGALYEGMPFEQQTGVRTVIVGSEMYTVLTAPFLQDGEVVGYIQVADTRRGDDLPLRALLYLLVSAVVSAGTFGVGLFFARRSLKPASQMMERLEQFTQDASHELRTPLTAVNTSLDLALATGEYKENILTAKEDLKDVFVLVERLLELARLDKFLLQTESVDLSELVRHVMEKHQPFAQEKGVTVHAELAPRVRVKGDAALLRQVVSNLLTNAIKFNRAGGRVDVVLASQSLTVRDTGKGIATDALPHIFDRFYQEDASRAKQGIGLGLALVKRIVELHGWSVSVTSEQGVGATFVVHFSASKKENTI